MAGKKKTKEPEEVLTPEAQFEKQLITVGLAGALELADEVDEDYICVPTDWPGFNILIGGKKPHLRGVPRNIHMEVFSELEHVGKTTLALQIGVAWQRRKLKVGVITIETKIPTSYLKELGYVTEKEEAEKQGLFAVRVMYPKVKAEDCETDMIYVEKVLDTLGIASNYFDLIIVDSVDALVSEADAAKTTEENTQMGGVAKPIKNFIRKHTCPISTILWINHMSAGLGQYAKSYTYGGKAIPRYSTVRLKLERVELLRENDKADPYGFVTKVSTPKNRVSPPFRFTLLYYIFGEGFSIDYDYFQLAIKQGIIVKSGAWVYVDPTIDAKTKKVVSSRLTVQGVLNMYNTLKSDAEGAKGVFDWVKATIDGEDVAVQELSAADIEQQAKQAALEDVFEVEQEEPAAA